ncbi:MAG: hypothetical protein AABZ61_11745 [Bacteroidota bacterium]|jgi:hypothetical protein
MAFAFTPKDFRKLSKVLRTQSRQVGKIYRYDIEQRPTRRRLTLEIYPNIAIGDKRGNLISVYTPSAHLQLHFCSGYVTSEMLGEVTFVGEYNGRLCGLIVEREGGCSLYANVNRELLSGDFTKLGPEVMLSGIALSLTESILPEAVVSPKRSRKKKTRR